MKTELTRRHAWSRRQLGDYFRVKHGYAFKSRFFAKDGAYVVLTPGNFRPDGGLKFEGQQKYYAGEFPPDFLLKAGDFLIVMTDLTQNAPILGSAAFVREDDTYLHNQRLGKVIELKEAAMDRCFLYHLLNSDGVRAQIKASATGATVRHTAPDRIYAVEVEVPPLPTQRKIAAILSAYDDLTENNLRRIEILAEMAQLVYREWFVKSRFPGHENVRMVESEMGPIPEGWDVVRTEDLVKRVASGKKYEQRTVSAVGAIPVLDQGRSGIIGYHHDEPGVRASEEEPVIVFANHTCYQRIIQYPFSAIQNVLPFVANPERCRNIYWLHWATKDLVEFSDYKGHWPEFMTKKLVCPPANYAEGFGQVVGPIVQLTYKLEVQNQLLQRTRDLLLPKLISGELDVSELDVDIGEEPA